MPLSGVCVGEWSPVFCAAGLDGTIRFEKEREVDEVGVGDVERQHGAERRCGRVWTVERRPDAIDAIDALDAVDANSVFVACCLNR